MEHSLISIYLWYVGRVHANRVLKGIDIVIVYYTITPVITILTSFQHSSTPITN